jgi:hypothetical protein
MRPINPRKQPAPRTLRARRTRLPEHRLPRVRSRSERGAPIEAEECSAAEGARGVGTLCIFQLTTFRIDVTSNPGLRRMLVLILRSAHARWCYQRRTGVRSVCESARVSEFACAARLTQHEGRGGQRIFCNEPKRRARQDGAVQKPTCACGRLRSIVSGLLFTMKIPTQNCEHSGVAQEHAATAFIVVVQVAIRLCPPA